MSLAIYYWDHALPIDLPAAMDVSLSMQSLNSSALVNWQRRFNADWNCMYPAAPQPQKTGLAISKIHIVVRKGDGRATGLDPIVAHGALVFVVDDFVSFTQNRRAEARREDHTSLAMFVDAHKRSPILSEPEVVAAHAGQGLSVWCAFLHFSAGIQGADFPLVRQQLHQGLTWELSRFRVRQVLMEASQPLYKKDIELFGLFLWKDGSQMKRGGLGSLEREKYDGELTGEHRSLFWCDQDACKGWKPGRPAGALFRYREPAIQLSKAEKRAVLCWYRYGHDCSIAHSILVKRYKEGGRKPISRDGLTASLTSAQVKLGIYEKDAIKTKDKSDFFSLAKIVESYPELLGPHPGPNEE